MKCTSNMIKQMLSKKKKMTAWVLNSRLRKNDLPPISSTKNFSNPASMIFSIGLKLKRLNMTQGVWTFACLLRKPWQILSITVSWMTRTWWTRSPQLWSDTITGITIWWSRFASLSRASTHSISKSSEMEMSHSSSSRTNFWELKMTVFWPCKK